MIEQLTKTLQEASETLKKNIARIYQLPNLIEEENKYESFEMIDEKDQENKSLPKIDLTYQYTFEETRNGFFQQFGDSLIYDESINSNIMNLKMNSVSSRRKDELFKRHKKEQQEKISRRKKELENNFAYQYESIPNYGQFFLNGQILSFKNDDCDKLKPDNDLNDTILENYLKFLQYKILPPEVEKKTFMYSSFFLGKLLGDILKDQPSTERQSEHFQERMMKKVQQNYRNVKRWTRKFDIFEKQFLVIPINAYKHWNCVIVVWPNALLDDSEMCRIIYLDSFFEKKSIFTEAIKAYLLLELRQKKKIQKQQINIPSYQLLVPRQTNTHDCGLYTLCYIQYFLLNPTILQANMQHIENRDQLRIFPRSIIFTMREGLRRLFSGLLDKEEQKASEEYLETRKKVFNEATEDDYDCICERQFQKYYRINLHLLDDKNRSSEEMEYLCKIKFYLDSEINHYEKDKYY